MSVCPPARAGRRAAAVLCTGQATLDHVLALDGELTVGRKHPAHDHHVVGGGVAANAAVTVARLGGAATLLGCVGDDAIGDAVLAGLAGEDVDTHLVQRVASVATPISAVLVSPTGARTVVNHTPHRLFERACPPLTIRPLDAVLVDGRWPAGDAGSLALAREHGVPGIVDGDRHLADGDDGEIMFDLATHIIFSADALADLSGCREPTAGLCRIAPRTRAQVAVTCGANGVHWLEHGTVRSLPAVRVDAVDTTGAGDVFHGAFALALAEGADTVTGFRFASAAAALKCTQPGARTGIPRRPAVERLLVGPPVNRR